MKIRYLGHSCFQWTTESGVAIVTDPYTKVGYELPCGINADIVTVSHEHFDHNFVSAIGGSPIIVRSTGDFEALDVKITGISTKHDPCGGSLRGNNAVYKILADGMTFCHLGDLGEECTDEIVVKIGQVDVLFIPIGGTYTIDAEQAKTYVEKIAPKIVIPMHYKPEDGGLDITNEQPFLSLFKEDMIERRKGEVSILESDVQAAAQKIIFMERADKK